MKKFLYLYIPLLLSLLSFNVFSQGQKIEYKIDSTYSFIIYNGEVVSFDSLNSKVEVKTCDKVYIALSPEYLRNEPRYSLYYFPEGQMVSSTGSGVWTNYRYGKYFIKIGNDTILHLDVAFEQYNFEIVLTNTQYEEIKDLTVQNLNNTELKAGFKNMSTKEIGVCSPFASWTVNGVRFDNVTNNNFNEVVFQANDTICVKLDGCVCASSAERCFIVQDNDVSSVTLSSPYLSKAYPNPFNDILIIKNDLLALEKVTIFDISGKKILYEELLSRNEVILKTDQLKEGLYFIELTTKNSKETLKLIRGK